MARNMFPKDFISLADVYLAYRKAKTEAFYERAHPTLLCFTEYEQELQKNIEKLHSLLVTGVNDWWGDVDFIGDYLYVPKSIDDSLWNHKSATHYRSIDPVIDWKQRFEEFGKKRLEATYRLIISPTVEFQIISALWIIKVGHKFEEKLDKKLSYGNRLRRKKHLLEDFEHLFKDQHFNGPINNDSLGLFSPYFSAYQNWRKKGLDAMEDLLKEEKAVTAITMDLASFYHNASPSFLLKPSFLKAIDVELSPHEKKFTKLILESINVWYKQTPDYQDRPNGALPVGLSASKIIANVLLYEFDKQVSQFLKPKYYGRYVDDIFLVFESPEDLTNGDSVLTYLSRNIDCIVVDRKKDEKPNLKIRFNYTADSDLTFTSKKQKIFSLSSEHGLDLINQISSQIREQSSEYRLLPEVPSSSVEMSEKALLASADASLTADALRKADAVSIRRLGLSLLIRDIESYSFDLSRDDWGDLRKEFYSVVGRHLVTPKGLFDLSGYFSRVFSLMVSNFDFDHAEKFVDQLFDCFELIESTTSNNNKNKERILACKAYFQKSFIQTALQSATTPGFDKWEKLRLLLKNKVFKLSEKYVFKVTKPYIKTVSEQLLLSDLGLRPYKDYWYYDQKEDLNIIKVPRTVSVGRVLRLGLVRRFREAAHLKVPHWPALVFPTRPLSIQEIALACPDVLEDSQLFKDSILGLRGARTRQLDNIGWKKVNSDDDCLFVPSKNDGKVNIALTNFETTEKQFENALNGMPDLGKARYERVNHLINNILKSSQDTNYVVFPECSLPLRWAINISSKLSRQGISLIAGIEYYEKNKYIRNDCIVSLATKWPGYSSNFLFLQPKLFPSHGEQAKISSAGKQQMYSKILPIYAHGNYYFGVLICSDLTNPKNRMHFQGKVDSLFVLEWNRDINTFSFLIEGAAHDVHTHVIQVNNRIYGDSRVRAPYRKEYERDSVRIKGGKADYFVMAEIDYENLRQYQRNGDMTDDKSDFKPVPVGFEMAESRKV